MCHSPRVSFLKKNMETGQSQREMRCEKPVLALICNIIRNIIHTHAHAHTYAHTHIIRVWVLTREPQTQDLSKLEL